jgi:tRNA U34 2-thiouridine synthase MnmA/TrmU
MGTDHPALYTNEFIIGKPHWLCRDFEVEADEHERIEILDSTFDFKYQHKHEQSKITYLKKIQTDDCLKYVLRTGFKMRAVTLGQFAVFYDRDECIGSSRIQHVPQTYHGSQFHGDIINTDKLLVKVYK